VSFRGTPKAVATDAENIELIGGDDPQPPGGYELLGVVTSSCIAHNGAGGIIDGPCNREAMLEAAQRKAAAVGGTALYAPDCRESVLSKDVRYQDGGTISASVRTQLSCQGSVVRAEGLAPGQRFKPAQPKGPAPARNLQRLVNIEQSGVVVEVTLPEGRSAKADDGPAVGELDAFPAGHRNLGELSARCMRGCARATARRGLMRAASRIGALAVSDLQCTLSGERWRCHGRAVGEPSAPPEPDGGRAPSRERDAATDAAATEDTAADEAAADADTPS
jgi:hypothetical protein